MNMAQLQTLMKTDMARGVAIGLGVAVLVPVAVSALAPIVRPVARSALKAGVIAYEKGREVTAEIGEVMDDLVAEVRQELQESRGHEPTQQEVGDFAEALKEAAAKRSAEG